MKRKPLHHARLRFMQRAGVRLGRKLHNALIEKIRNGKCVTLGRCSNTRSRLIVDGYLVVYSRKTKRIVTLLKYLGEETGYAENNTKI
jgi:hypothetical protein